MRHVGKIKNNDKGNYFLNYGKSVSHYHHKHLKVEKEGSQMTHLEPCEAGAHDAMLNIRLIVAKHKHFSHMLGKFLSIIQFSTVMAYL